MPSTARSRPIADGHRLRVLALDFDGVVSDSAPESFLVALRAFGAVRPGSGLSAHPARARFGLETAPALDEIRADAAYAAFLEMMPLGNRAEDYAVVLGAIDAGATLPDQAAYDRCRAAWSQADLDAFHERFYRERKALSQRDPEGWRALMAPYAALRDLLRRRSTDVVPAIATAKDLASVSALLEAYGLAGLFRAEHVLDKETGVSKQTHLECLRERCGVDFADITFVDDKVNHLDSVAPLGVHCALAAWGYNGPREERLARDRGHTICALDDAEALLFPPPLGRPRESP